MAGAPLEFGAPTPGQTYRRRPAAFGVAERNGLIAVARVSAPGGGFTYALPGGGIDVGEQDADALVREFGEETGLVVRAGALLDHAAQYTVSDDGEHRRNVGALMTVEVVGEDPGLKIEDDHELVWLEPLDAIRQLRHESHAWAVSCWLRRR